MKKIGLILGIVLLLLAFVYINKKRGSGVVKVNVVLVEKRNIQEWVDADGEAEPEKLVKIGSDVTARIEKILKREGDTVKRGDTLCILDPSTYSAKVKEIHARLKMDLYSYENSKKDYMRALSLYKKGLISQKSFEEAKLNLDKLSALLKQDSSLIEQAERNLSKTVITSPIDGIVLAVNKEEGEMAIVGTVNTPGSTIMTVAEMDKMEVKGYVDETGILKIKPGQKVIITLDAFGERKFKGVVYRVVGMPETNSGMNVTTYPVYVRIKDNIKLFPGMAASIRILVNEARDVVSVPLEAMGRDRQGYYVWLVKNGICEKKRIEKGLESFEYAEVKKGLSVGDTVIVGPISKVRTLKDSTRIEIKEVQKSAKRRKFRRFNRN